MTDASLLRRLESFGPSNLDEARERTKLAARVKLTQGRSWEEGAAEPAFKGRTRPPLLLATPAVAVTLVIALIIAGLIVTPPGQAITSWIGDRVGLGQPGGHPSLQGLRKHAQKGQAGGSAYVLVRGHGLAGPYEYITYRTKQKPGQKSSTGARCFELDLPKRNALQGGSCGLPPASMGLRLDAAGGAGGNVGPEAEVHFISGRVSEDVASVKVEFEGRSIPVELSPVPAALAKGLGLPGAFKTFVAFFPHAGHGGRVAVTASDRTGAAVAEGGRPLPDAFKRQAENCEYIKRSVSEGKLPRRFIGRNCNLPPGG